VDSLSRLQNNGIVLKFLYYIEISETTPDFSPSYTTTDDRQSETDTSNTIPETTRQENYDIIGSSGTSSFQESTFSNPSQTTVGISTTDFTSSSSSSSSTTVTTTMATTQTTTTTPAPTTTSTTTTTTTRRTTIFIPPETTVRQTPPPEPTTEDDFHHNEIDNNHLDYVDNNNIPELPEERETEPPYRPPVYNPNYPGSIGYQGNNNFNPSQGTERNPDKMNRIKNKNARINSEAEERTAMIIGIVAGALIAVILVILIVLWIKSNGDANYKMEHDMKYGHGANAALLGGHNAGGANNQHHGSMSHHGGSAGQGNGSQQYRNGYQNGSGGGSGYDGGHRDSMGMNGSLRQQQQQNDNQYNNSSSMSAGLVQPKAKRNSKDVKEWYV
jgi:neurexin